MFHVSRRLPCEDQAGAFVRCILAFTALSLVVGFAAIADETERPFALLLEDGSMVEGRLIALEDDAFVIEVEGQAEPVRVSLDDVEPIHVYYAFRVQLDRRARGELVDGEARSLAQDRMHLGDYCLGQRLYAQARDEYEKAVALDASLEGQVSEGLAACTDGAAGEIYREATALMERGHTKEGKERFEEVVDRYPGTGAAVLADDALIEIRQRSQRRQDRIAEREAERAARQEEIRQKRIAILDRYLEYHVSRLEAERDEAADATNYSGVRADLVSLGKKIEKLYPYVEEFAKYDEDRANVWTGRIKADLISVFLMLAVLDLESQNSRGANYWITQTLLLDPDNERALDLRDVNIAYGIDEDPFRQPLGVLAGRITRGATNNEELNAFLRRTGPQGLAFLRRAGVNLPGSKTNPAANANAPHANPSSPHANPSAPHANRGGGR